MPYYDKIAKQWHQATGYDVYPTQKVLNEKSGLRDMGKVPLALVIKCSKPDNAVVKKLR